MYILVKIDRGPAPRVLLFDWVGLWAVCVLRQHHPLSLLPLTVTDSAVHTATDHPSHSPYPPKKNNSETTIGEVVSTNGVELDAALDALSKKANAQETGARVEKLEKAVAEVGLVCSGVCGLYIRAKGKGDQGIPVALDR